MKGRTLGLAVHTRSLNLEVSCQFSTLLAQFTYKCGTVKFGVDMSTPH